MRDNWMRKANCVGHPFELFEYQDNDSPLTVGMDFRERMEFNAANFKLAEEICIECPVMLRCPEEADLKDKYWTVRGGEPPDRLQAESKRFERPNNGRPVGSRNKEPRPQAAPGSRVCQNGHYQADGGRCKACKRDRNLINQRVRRAREASGKAS